MEEWGNHEDLWCRKTGISRFISHLFAALPALLSAESNLFIRDIFIMSLSSFFFFFTNQEHGTGRYLEDGGINVVITASNKTACRHLWPKSIPPQTSNISTKLVSVTLQYQRVRERERESNFTDAFTWSLTFSVAASILDLDLSASLRLARWQVYRVTGTRALLHHKILWLRTSVSLKVEMSS